MVLWEAISSPFQIWSGGSSQQCSNGEDVVHQGELAGGSLVPVLDALAGAYQTWSAAALLVGAAQLEAVAAREAEVGQDEVQHVHPHELAAEEAPVATHLDVRQQTFSVLLMPTLAHWKEQQL